MRKTFLILLLMSYLNMNARVTIGRAVIHNVNSFRIYQSVKEISDKATITLARNIAELKGSPLLEHIRAGYEVKIECGYNGEYGTEFTGFVRPGISSEFPLVVECDELYLLRQNNHVLTYMQVTLKELLTTIAPEMIIECPDVQLGRMVISHASSLEVLRNLREKWGLFARVNGNTLSVGWPFDYRPSFTKNHELKAGWNIKDAKNLKFKREADFETRVIVEIHQTSGKTIQVEAGSKKEDARIMRVQRKGIDEGTALNLARSLHKQNIYNGLSGYVVGFCNPRVQAGDSVTFIDPRDAARNGTYLVERVELEYAEAHINRTSYLSYQVG